MKRIVSIDIARSLCMIWIVAFWHMGPYLGIDNYNILNRSITGGALAAFTFISGLFLGKKSVSIYKFYKSRFIRIYPLFFLSCIIVYLGHGGINSLPHLIRSLTGLSIFWPPHTPTLWYVDMLIVMYAVTPLLVSRNKELYAENKLIPVGGLLKAVCIYSMLYIGNVYLPMEEALMNYFPFYVAGVMTPLNAVKLDKFRVVRLLSYSTISLSILIILIVKCDLPLDSYIKVLINSCLVVLIIVISNFIELIVGLHLKTFFKHLSYASLCAYLFHRILYKFFKLIFADSNDNIPLFIAPLMVMSLFALAYFIQKSYDNLIVKLKL